MSDRRVSICFYPLCRHVNAGPFTETNAVESRLGDQILTIGLELRPTTKDSVPLSDIVRHSRHVRNRKTKLLRRRLPAPESITGLTEVWPQNRS